MNRRDFFNTIARVAAAASVSPTIFIPKFEPVKWKVERPGNWKYVINPQWLEAPYELGFFVHDRLFVPSGNLDHPLWQMPRRFSVPDAYSEPISPYIKVPA